jgi:hypothetical protein
MTHPLLVFCLAVGLIQATSQAQPVPATTQSTMTIDDVIKMVQVKLADDLIISQIRKNGRPFSLSPDDMIRLKTTGASDNVIRAMIDPQAHETPPAPGSVATAVPAATTAPPLPSAYGYYLRDEHKMSDLGQVQVITKFGLTLGNIGSAVDGLSDQTPILRIDTQSPTIIVYQQNVQPSALQLSALSFVRNMKAHQFNMLGTAPQFFFNVYKKDPNETIPIDLWRPSGNVQMRIEPVEGKAGMYKLVPAVQLELGKYALYLPDSIHADDVVFSASVGRQSTIFAFEVVQGEPPASPTSGDVPASPASRDAPAPPPRKSAEPKLTEGALYLTKADGKMTALRGQRVQMQYVSETKKIVNAVGEKSTVRFSQHDKDSFLVRTPPGKWAEANTFKVYVFQIKNGKRTAIINNTSRTFTVEPVDSTGQYVKISFGGELAPGEYAFGPGDPVKPKGGLGYLVVITFGVD